MQGKMEQLIVVEIDENPKLKLQTWNNRWETIKSFENVKIGREGATMFKEEGDYKTPLGLFKLGPAFGTLAVESNYPYIKITPNSYWVDDVASPFYNKWVEVEGNLDYPYDYIVNANVVAWASAEKLIEYKSQYELGVVIEYNTAGAIAGTIKGKGSVIFLHVVQNENTAGCIALPLPALKFIVNWLDVNKNPHILIKSNKKN